MTRHDHNRIIILLVLLTIITVSTVSGETKLLDLIKIRGEPETLSPSETAPQYDERASNTMKPEIFYVDEHLTAPDLTDTSSRTFDDLIKNIVLSVDCSRISGDERYRQSTCVEMANNSVRYPRFHAVMFPNIEIPSFIMPSIPRIPMKYETYITLSDNNTESAISPIMSPLIEPKPQASYENNAPITPQNNQYQYSTSIDHDQSHYQSFRPKYQRDYGLNEPEKPNLSSDYWIWRGNSRPNKRKQKRRQRRRGSTGGRQIKKNGFLYYEPSRVYEPVLINPYLNQYQPNFDQYNDQSVVEIVANRPQRQNRKKNHAMPIAVSFLNEPIRIIDAPKLDQMAPYNNQPLNDGYFVATTADYQRPPATENPLKMTTIDYDENILTTTPSSRSVDDDMIDDKKPKENDLSARIERVFERMQENDDSQCLMRIVCEIGFDKNQSRFRKFGARITNLFRFLGDPKPGSSAFIYQTAFHIGHNNNDSTLCQRTFVRCKKNIEEISQSIEAYLQ